MTILDFNSARRQGETLRQGIDLDDIRNRLHDHPKAFIDWLYGGRAYFTRHDARIGNIDGEPGSSLSIDLSTGLWKDHATDSGGDLIALYREWRGYAGDTHFVTSLKEIARDYLGDPVDVEAVAWTPSARERIQQQKAKLGDKPRQENIDLGAPVASWKYYDLHGKVIASVVRFEPDGTPESKTFRPWCFKTVDGQEKWTMGAPNIRPLYNLPEVASSTTVVLVEGEKCAEALRSIGVVATTAMQGAKAPIDKTDWTPLAGKRVIIWPDNDEPGLDYARAVAARLAALGCTVLGVTPPDDAPPKWDAADCVADGSNAHGLIESAAPVSGSKARGKIQMLDIDDLEHLRPPEFLVDGVITVNGLSMVWGRSGAMKSFVGADFGLCVATGLLWHGKPVKQGLVIYVAAEGAHGLGKRIVGWRKTRGKDCPKPDFLLIPQPIALSAADEMNALVEAILAIGRNPALIIVDTVARTFGAGDENKQADMNAYVQALDRLRAATGAHVMVIHHSGVHEDKRERGSNVLRGAADTIIKVSRRADKIDLINRSPEGKQKDFDEFPTVKLRAVKVSFTAIDGTEVSTIVMNEREDDDEVGDDEGDGGGEGASNRSGGPRGVNQTKLYEAMKAADDKAPGLAMDKHELCARAGVKKTSFRNAIEALVTSGLVDQSRDITSNTFVWRMAGR